MPLTAAEKSKRYRDKLKERISPDEYKRRDRERKKKKRQGLSNRELKKLRAAQAENQRRYRQKVCEKENLNCSAQSLGKATKRVIETLPKSPRKRSKLVKILAEKFAACDTEVILAQSGCQGLPKSTLDAVTSHFCHDDISWQSPSRKDVIAIKANGEKKLVAKRFLRMSLKECHALYLERNPENKIGLTKFTLLRPTHVSLSRHFPHNLCICKYHENVRLLLQAVKIATSATNIQTEFRPFIDSITCNQENENCMYRRCDACVSKFDDVFSFPAAVEDTRISWYQWTSVEGHMEKASFIFYLKSYFFQIVYYFIYYIFLMNMFVKFQVEQHGNLHECVALLREQTPSFLVHTFIKRQQSQYFEAEKQKADDEYAVIQVDFAENFAIVHQDEIQSAHWSHKQITLFTCCAHVGDGVQSYVIVSDEMNHGKYEVAEFLDCIIRDLQTKFPGLNTVSFFSDGAASQFKQKYLFENLTYFKHDYNISCSWNFFATSHGKGAVDGIGGGGCKEFGFPQNEVRCLC
ncbi:uncharacterized protein LOC117100325 [Anneissia japonica]|uniref:uncharacterized protein LOC117100325 n=1 Tax=Anneissia japonica TaxID=1529436 RepID=UPI001425A29A|nr:uncharacterized protein LOC117100325 [Anneissia japonica]